MSRNIYPFRTFIGEMKLLNQHTKLVASKGDRLKWTPLKEAKIVRLTEERMKGKQLTSEELVTTRKTDSNSNNVIVP